MNAKQETSAQEPSWLLGYLPHIYADNGKDKDKEFKFFYQFLLILESIWKPLDHKVNKLETYFNPSLAPPEFLSWLGTWVGLILDENLKEEQQRKLIREAADLYRWRGTGYGLRRYLEIYFEGSEIKIEDKLNQPHHFIITLKVPKRKEEDQKVEDETKAKQIINQQKPAHTTYKLDLSVEEK